MARVYPFRALRYNPSLVRLEDVATQPYDKITPAMQQAYYQRSPYNLVRIILGLPELPFLTFNGAARFGSAHWKLGPLAAYCEGRPAAWIDDNFDESCYEWARDRDQPTLLIPTEPDLGLEEVQTEALIAWAKGV